MSERFDVAIVGAGPAGSTCALRLARQGHRVLMLERMRFPRDKPCGGGLTMRGVAEMPVSVQPVVESVIRAMDIRLGYGGTLARYRSARPLVLMTRRSRLDAYLADEAIRAGAQMRDGARVRSIDLDASGATVRGDGFRARAGIVIGADGANGISRRALGLGGADPEHMLAYEGNVAVEHFDIAALGDALLIEVDTVPGGYAWIFPKGDHANVGVGGWPSEGPRLRAHLARLCTAHGVDPARLVDVRGYRIPMGDLGAPLARGRAALIGDAAGLADPLSGDGISEAVVSSRMAAAAGDDCLEGRATGLEPYERAVRHRLALHSAVSWWAKAIADRSPAGLFRLATSRTGARLMVGDVRGSRRPILPPAALYPLVRGLERAARRVAGAG